MDSSKTHALALNPFFVIFCDIYDHLVSNNKSQNTVNYNLRRKKIKMALQNRSPTDPFTRIVKNQQAFVQSSLKMRFF